MLRKIHTRLCGEYRPWWQETDPADYHSAERDAAEDGVDAATYAAGRKTYLDVTKRKPPESSEK